MPDDQGYVRGDFVTLRYQGDETVGMISLASENQKSLAVMFEGIFAGHAAMMLLLLEDDGDYRSIATDMVITIERIER
jgi:hypothetical protein